MTNSAKPKLSICIGTFNRSEFISHAIESIISQVTSECEIVVSDNASTDSTEQVVLQYALRCGQLRYYKQSTNVGFDRNFDRAVQLARGEYCWLFSDDDLMKPGAIAAVLDVLRGDYSLVLVNGEHRDFSMSVVRAPNFFGIDSDRVYAAADAERMFREIGTCLVCICCVVIRRPIWLARERQRYYGSWFIHTAVIMQEPLPGGALVLAQPFMSLRLDNNQLHATFDVWFINWPSLVWSFPITERTKRRFCAAEPWRRLKYLLALRMMRLYSLEDYRRSVRPRLRSLREKFSPAIVAYIPAEVAGYLYRLCSLVAGWPRSPRDAYWTMLPESLKALRN